MNIKHLDDAELQEQREWKDYLNIAMNQEVIAAEEETVAEITLSIHPVAFCLSSWHGRTTFSCVSAFGMGSKRLNLSSKRYG